MRIDKATFHHIFTKKSDFEFQRGITYTIGKGPNIFWQEFQLLEMKYRKQPYQGLYAVELACLHGEKLQEKNSELTKEVFNFLASSVFEMGMLIRELVFEETRKEGFITLPSRQNCLYLLDENTFEHWTRVMKNQCSPQKIVKLECSGEIHKGSYEYLGSDSFTYNEYKTNARNYWNGINVVSREYEILFTGNAKVLEIFDF